MMSGRVHFTTSKLRISRILVVRFFAYIIPKMRTSTPETVATGNGKMHLYAARNIPFLTTLPCLHYGQDDQSIVPAFRNQHNEPALGPYTLEHLRSSTGAD